MGSTVVLGLWVAAATVVLVPAAAWATSPGPGGVDQAPPAAAGATAATTEAATQLPPDAAPAALAPDDPELGPVGPGHPPFRPLVRAADHSFSTVSVRRPGTPLEQRVLYTGWALVGVVVLARIVFGLPSDRRPVPVPEAGGTPRGFPQGGHDSLAAQPPMPAGVPAVAIPSMSYPSNSKEAST